MMVKAFRVFITLVVLVSARQAIAQTAVIGNRLPAPPIGEPIEEPPAPSNLRNFQPANGSTGIPLFQPFSGEADDYTTCELFLATTDPPMTSAGTASQCNFNINLSPSTTYYFYFRFCNLTLCVDSDTFSAQTQAPTTGDLMVQGDNFISQGWLTRGVVLPQGVADDGLVIVRTSDDTEIPTQTDVKATWPDGTIKHAAVTANFTQEGIYNIRDGEASGAGFVVATIRSFVVNLTVYDENNNDTAHSFTMPTTVNTNSMWLDGPLVREWRHNMVLSPVPSGCAQHLTGRVDYRVYNDGKARPRFILDNVKRIVTPAGATCPVVYSGNIVINGVVVYTFGNAPTAITVSTNGQNVTVCDGCSLVPGDWIQITQPANANHLRYNRVLRTPTQGTSVPAAIWPGIGTNSAVPARKVKLIHALGARWTLAFPIDGFDEAEYEPDFSTFYQAKAFPEPIDTIDTWAPKMTGPQTACWTNMSSLQAASDINPTSWAGGVPYEHCWEPLGIGFQPPNQQNQGGRDELGLQPGTYNRYLIHKTQALRAVVLKMGELAGTWAVHFAHSNNDESMVDLDDVPMLVWSGTTADMLKGGGISGMQSPEGGQQHVAAASYLPYLLTVERYHMEELNYYAGWGLHSYRSSRDCGTKNFARGCLYSTYWNNIRGGGWTLRDMGNAANYLPDGHEHKEYFRIRVQTALDDYDADALADLSVNPLGPPLTPFNPSYAYIGNFFMRDYIVSALQHVIRQGGYGTSGTFLRNQIIDFHSMLFNHPDWPAHKALNYYVWWMQNDGVTPHDSILSMYEYSRTVPRPGTNPPTPPIPNDTTDTIGPGYGHVSRVTALIGVHLGRPNSQQHYDYLMAQPDVGPTIGLPADLDNGSGGAGSAFAFKNFE